MSDEPATETSLLGRRSYLKLGTAAAGALSLGAAATGTTATDGDEVAFDRVVNAVDDLGMDPTGGEPVDGALADAFGHGTLVEFPAGRYLLERDHRARGLRRFGISGLGERRGDVEFVTPPGDGPKELDFVDSRGIVVENVEFERATRSALRDSAPEDGNLVFSSVDELEAIAREADAGTEPWASARDQLLAAAERSVDADPVVYDRDDGRALAEAARDNVRNTALAYAVTGEERFAEAAVEHVHAFLVDEDTRYDPEDPVIPHARIINSLVIPGVLFGASIVKNHPHWETFGGEQQVQEWCRTYVRTCKAYSRDRWGDERRMYKHCSNRFTYRLADRMANAVYLRDDALWNECLGIWDDVHNARISFPDSGGNLIVDADGAPNGRSRKEGWEYALFDLDALVACAEIAHRKGTDLYGYVDDPDEADIKFDGHKGERDGPLLHRTFEWFNNVFRNPDEFEGRLDGGVYPPNIGPTGRGLTAYEFAGSRYDGALGDEIRSVRDEFFDRPDRNRKYTGYPTLTNGDLRRLDADGSSGSGSGSDGGSDDGTADTQTLDIVGEEYAEYEFAVSGDLQHNTDRGTVDWGDDIDGATATGTVGRGGTDAFDFTGDVTDFSVTGAVAVVLNGQRVDPSTLGDGSDDGGSDDGSGDGDTTARTLDVVGKEYAEYEFAVSGDLQHNTDRGTVDWGDDIEGTTASGTVGKGGTDAFDFTGDVTDFSVTGAVSVLLDGEEVDPATLGDGSDGGADPGPGVPDDPSHDEWPIPDVGEPAFDRVVDAVADLGVDDTGEVPIGEELTGLDDGTLVEFPAGEYTIEANTSLYAKERVGLRAADGATFRATADSSTDGVTTTLFFNDCRDVLLDNLTFDQGGFNDDVPNVGVTLTVRDGLLVRDLTMAGANDLRNEGDMAGLTVNVTDPDGEALVEGFRHCGPADYDEVPTDAYSWAPAAVRRNHEGHVHFVDCHIEGGHGGGAVFSGKHAGTTGFDRCYLVNNNVAQARLGAGVVRDCTLYVDWQRTHPGSRTVTDYANATNGIYIGPAPETSTETLIENNDLWLHTQPYPPTFGERKWENGAAVLVDPGAGGVTVRGNRIRMDTRQRLVLALDGSETRWSNGTLLPEDERWVRVEDNDLTGMGRGEELVRLVNRPGSVVSGNRYDDDAADPDVSPPFATAIPPRRDLLGNAREGWDHELRSELSREQLVAAIPDAYRERIEAADLFAPYNAVESRENTDEPVAGEGGLNTFRVVDGGADVEFDLDVGACADTADITEGMIHHGPRAMSDNRHMMWTIPDDGTVQPPYERTGRFSDSRIDNEDAALLDGADITARNLPEYVDYLTSNPREFYSNVHTERFETEAVRGQLRPADFDALSREELLETVLATAGPDALDGEAEVLPSNTVTVVGYRSEPAHYSITVDGTVEPNPDRGTFTAEDDVSDGTAEGTVGAGGVDSYVFSGAITAFTLDGEAAVYVDGQQVDPRLLGRADDPTLSNVMYVDGSGSSAVCDYEFAVSDGVAKAPELGSVEAEDAIDDGTVTGSVVEDVDAYRFAGVVERMRMDGSARVQFGSED